MVDFAWASVAQSIGISRFTCTIGLVALLILYWVAGLLFNYTVSQKNDNDVLGYNFNAHKPILIIFGRDIAEWIFY